MLFFCASARSGSRFAKLGRLASKSRHLPMDGDWEWGGCGDNVNFGFKKSREFMDAPFRKRSDIKTLLKRHNNDAGRLVSIIHIMVFVISERDERNKWWVLLGAHAGGAELHEDRVQVPRTVGLVHGENLLAQDAAVPRGGQPTERVVRRCSQGHPGKRWPQLHYRGTDHQTTGPLRPDLQRGLAGLLPCQSQNWSTRHPRQGMQCHLSGGRRLWAAVLRTRLRYQDRQGEGQLRMQV